MYNKYYQRLKVLSHDKQVYLLNNVSKFQVISIQLLPSLVSGKKKKKKVNAKLFQI